MQRCVNGFATVGLEILHEQIKKAIPGLKNLAVVQEFQARVQVTVMTQPALDVFRAELCFLKNVGVRLKPDQGAIWFARFTFLLVFDFSLLEGGFDKLAFAMAADQEILGKRIDGFGAYAVESDTELENIVVIFCTGVDLRNALDDFSQRNATAEIAHRDGFVFDGELDFLAGAHDKLVNGIIDDLFEQDVTPVIVMGAIANAANVHA